MILSLNDIFSFPVRIYRLLRLTETGSSDANRGAVLNTARVTAMLIIPANDDPHGVISWKNTLVISQEDGPKNTTLSVYIMRQFGLIGDIVVSYETVQLSSVAHVDERVAMPGIDYKAVRGTVEIPAGHNSTQITLDVAHVSLFFVDCVKICSCFCCRFWVVTRTIFFFFSSK